MAEDFSILDVKPGEEEEQKQSESDSTFSILDVQPTETGTPERDSGFSVLDVQPSTGMSSRGTGGGSLGSGDRGRDKRLLKDVDRLEEKADEGGVWDSVKSGGLTTLGAVTDILSRLNYASAGVAEELLTERGGGGLAALKRAGREIFSGAGKIPNLLDAVLPGDMIPDNLLPDLEGDKEGYGQVLEQSGWGTGFEFSDIPVIGSIYNDTGEGWRFQKGGWADISGRGIVGFALDVVLDPLTYMTVGVGKGTQLVLKQGAKVALKKMLSVAGEDALKIGMRKVLGASDGGLKLLRKGLWESLPNAEGKILLSKSDEAVQATWRNLRGLAKDAPIEDIAFKDLTGHELAELTATATRIAKEDLASKYLSDPEAWGHIFDDGGVKFFENSRLLRTRTVPGTVWLEERMSQIGADALQGIRGRIYGKAAEGSKFYMSLLESGRVISRRGDVIARHFHRDMTRDPIYLDLKKTLLAKQASMQADLVETVQKAVGDLKLKPQQWDELTYTIDDATRRANAEAAKSALAGQAKNTEDIMAQIVRDASSVAPTMKTLQGVAPERLQSAIGFTVRFLRGLDEEEFSAWRRNLREVGVTEKAIRIAGDEIDKLAIAENGQAALGRELEGSISDITDFIDSSVMKQPLGENQRRVLENYMYQRAVRLYHSNVPTFFTNEAEKIVAGLNEIARGGYYFNRDRLSGRHMAVYSAIPRRLILGESLKRGVNLPGFPDLRPLLDLRETLRRRVANHVEDLVARDWDRSLKKQFNIDAMGVIPDEIFRGLDVGREAFPTQEGWDRFQKAWTQWSIKKARFRAAAEKVGTRITEDAYEKRLHRSLEKTIGAFGFTDLGENAVARKAWFRRELGDVASRRDLVNVLRVYGPWLEKDWDLMPRFTGLEAYRQFRTMDPSAYKKVDTIFGRADVPVEILSDLKHLKDSALKSRELADSIRWYDTFNNTFKSLVTAYFPSFHFRNWYSNVAQSFTDLGVSSMSPAIIKRTWDVWRGNPGTFVTDLGQALENQELRRLSQELGVWKKGEPSIFEFTGEYSPFQAGKLKAAVQRPGRFMREKVGSNIENEGRLQLWLNYIRRGMEPGQAADRVNKFLFDYQALNNAERELFRRVIPFYVFMRKNLPLQAENVIKRPGTVTTQLKLVRERPEETQQMAIWWADDGSLVRLRRDGSQIQVLSNLDLPLLDIKRFDTLLGKGEAWREILASTSPILRAPYEMATDTDIFTGRQSDRKDGETFGLMFDKAPRSIRQFMGYAPGSYDNAGRRIKPSIDQDKFFLVMQGWMVSRILRTSDKAFEKLFLDPENRKIGEFAAWTLTGLEKRGIDLDAEARRKLRQRKIQLEEALSNSGQGYQMNIYRDYQR